MRQPRLDAVVSAYSYETPAGDEAQSSAPPSNSRLLSAEEQVCPHTTYVRELASEITYGLVGADRGGEIAEGGEVFGDGGQGAPGALEAVAVGAYGLGRQVLGRGLWAPKAAKAR
jgi:hypothetical protein